MMMNSMKLAAAAVCALAVAAYACPEGQEMESGCEDGVCAVSEKPAAKAGPAEMNTAALLALQRAGVSTKLLDARPGVAEMIPGAISLPADSSDDAIAERIPDRNTLYVTYCGGPKCGLSARLAGRLAALGYGRVLEFRDGWAGWSEHKAGGELGEPEISPAALKVFVDARSDMRILDARSGKYDDGRRIPGAVSLNAGSGAGEVEKVLPLKGQLVITYCANLKCPASHMLAARLMELGYANVIEMPQGIEGWAAAGYEVQKSGS